MEKFAFQHESIEVEVLAPGHYQITGIPSIPVYLPGVGTVCPPETVLISPAFPSELLEAILNARHPIAVLDPSKDPVHFPTDEDFRRERERRAALADAEAIRKEQGEKLEALHAEQLARQNEEEPHPHREEEREGEEDDIQEPERFKGLFASAVDGGAIVRHGAWYKLGELNLGRNPEEAEKAYLAHLSKTLGED